MFGSYYPKGFAALVGEWSTQKKLEEALKEYKNLKKRISKLEKLYKRLKEIKMSDEVDKIDIVAPISGIYGYIPNYTSKSKERGVALEKFEEIIKSLFYIDADTELDCQIKNKDDWKTILYVLNKLKFMINDACINNLFIERFYSEIKYYYDISMNKLSFNTSCSPNFDLMLQVACLEIFNLIHIEDKDIKNEEESDQ